MIVAIRLKEKKPTKAHGTAVANSEVLGAQDTGPSLGVERVLVPHGTAF